MPGALQAWIGVLAVGIVPGLAVLRALRVRPGFVVALGLVPAVSLGFTYVVSEVSRLTGIPFSPPLYVAATVAVAALAVIRHRRVGQPRPAASEERVATPLHWASLAMLFGGVVLGLATWGHALQDRAQVPPNFDATYHGYFTRQISETASVRAEDVLIAAPGLHKPIERFYPLGMHAAAAMAHRLAGGSVDDVLNVMVIAAAAISLPAGMFAIARRLAPDAPLAWGFTALAVPMLAIFPYKPIAWGGIPLIVATGLTAAVAVFTFDALVRRWSVAAAFAAALAMVGIFMSHTSEIPMLIVLVGLLVAEEVRRTAEWGRARRAVPRLAVIGLFSAALLLTILPQFRGGVTERSALAGYLTDSLEGAVGNILVLYAWLGQRHVIYAVLSFIGLGVVLYTRRGAWWALGFAGTLALYLFERTNQGSAARLLGLPWYHSAERVAYNFAFFLPIFVGALLAFVVDLLVRRREPIVAAVIGGCVALGVVASVGRDAYHDNARTVRGYYDATPVGPDERAAFGFLARQTRDGSTVLTDRNADGSLWMFAIAGARPVFLLPPPDAERRALWGPQDTVLERVNDIGRDPQVDAAVKALRIRFAFFDDRAIPGATRSLTLDKLAASPRGRLVFHRGTAYVYEFA
jgi:hypothetical protein